MTSCSLIRSTPDETSINFIPVLVYRHFSVKCVVIISLMPSRMGSACREFGSDLAGSGTIYEEIECMVWKVDASLMKSFVSSEVLIFSERM